MTPSLRIAFIASEAVPYAKTGGLADVVGALPKALAALGHEVVVILPKYTAIEAERYGIKPFLSPLGVWMGEGEEWCAAYVAGDTKPKRGRRKASPGKLTTYFIESHKFFNRWGLYHDAAYQDYLDNPRRFGFFSRAGLQLCIDMGFSPDVVHVHDWQTALTAAYLKIWHWNDPVLGKAASVLTIHNLAYQGVFPGTDYAYLGLQASNFTAEKLEDHGKVNFLKGGIQFADFVNTVSPTYADETRTPEGGFGLAPYLNDRGESYTGILNGVDYSRWDPREDPLIPANYSMEDLSGKATCKAELQKRFLLQVAPDVPVIGVISRLVAQKGMHLVMAAIEPILANMQVQFVLLGAGEKGLEAYFGDLPKRFPGSVGSYIGYNEELSHLIEAGADFFLMPSLSEPCGLNQIYSLKYGTPPIVRATGGLDDTVAQYNERNGTGTGFKFWEASANALYYAVGWAVSTYYDRREHMERIMRAGMGMDFSWKWSAQAYEGAYRKAIENKKRLE